MIAIHKHRPPEKLIRLQHVADEMGLCPKDAYNLLKNPLKGEVRAKLIEEQGELCGYCMCRIPRDDAAPYITPITIEHMFPRDPESGEDMHQGLDYQNMLAVCHGNRGPLGTRTLADLTCDAHRRNTVFRKVNPCKPETLTSIFYTLDGRIDAEDPDVQFDLVNTLNLNCPSAPLIAERKSALDHLIAEIGQVPEEMLCAYCVMIQNEFQAETSPKTPYVGILLWYLETLIEALAHT